LKTYFGKLDIARVPKQRDTKANETKEAFDARQASAVADFTVATAPLAHSGEQRRDRHLITNVI
jgi:hypothetical protein